MNLTFQGESQDETKLQVLKVISRHWCHRLWDHWVDQCSESCPSIHIPAGWQRRSYLHTDVDDKCPTQSTILPISTKSQGRAYTVTLVVMNIIGGCDPFLINYLVVQTGNVSSTTVTAPITSLVSASPSDSGHRRSQTAIIAGSVSAALACILLLGLGYFLVRRRKRRDSVELSNELSGKYL